MTSIVSARTTAVRWLSELDPEQPAAGGKASSLARLRQAGLPVPDGLVVLPSGFADGGPTPETWEAVQRSLASMRTGDPEAAFAIRSSAVGEDSAGASFAGEFTSVLGARTDEEVRAATLEVYESRHNERAAAYSRARGLTDEREIAVVVQRLVPSECSGIMFTANPVTGRRDEVVISAAWGLGESIVGGLVTPDSITVGKASGCVLTRATSDKRVMTVRDAGGTVERPVPEARRRAPVLSDSQAIELARLGADIEALYGLPVDVEWAMSGGSFAIVQARPITALPQAEESPLSTWRLPKGAYSAMRNNIVELMVDPLSPLFATLGLDAVNASLHDLMAMMLGKRGLLPERTIISVNSYAYYNGSLRAGQILWLMANLVPICRRMFRGAVGRWVDVGRPKYLAQVERWRDARWHEMPARSVLAAARELAEAAILGYGMLVSGALPAAWISEGLFTLVYERLCRRRGDPPAATYLLGFDSVPVRAEKSLYDVALSARDCPDLAVHLRATPAPEIVAALGRAEPPMGVDEDAWRGWRGRFLDHLRLHGHAIYSLDFSNPVPADDPSPLVDTMRMYLDGDAADPHARQRGAAERRERASADLLGRLRGWRLRLCRRLLSAAQRYAPLREDGLADVGLGYPCLRGALRELGRRCSEAGAIAHGDDVFWMTGDELSLAAERLDRGEAPDALTSEIAQRKASLRAARRAVPPRTITQMRVLGREVVRTSMPRVARQGTPILKGAAASAGRVTAPACVVTGPEDFASLRAGSVLVAPLTTPAWTPLFARAAAIVTDVGGPLSHGSIVAREYGIPAVLGTGDATKRIRTGQMVTVDGTAGTVTIAQDS